MQQERSPMDGWKERGRREREEAGNLNCGGISGCRAAFHIWDDDDDDGEEEADALARLAR